MKYQASESENGEWIVQCVHDWGEETLLRKVATCLPYPIHGITTVPQLEKLFPAERRARRLADLLNADLEQGKVS